MLSCACGTPRRTASAQSRRPKASAPPRPPDNCYGPHAPGLRSQRHAQVLRRTPNRHSRLPSPRQGVGRGLTQLFIRLNRLAPPLHTAPQTRFGQDNPGQPFQSLDGDRPTGVAIHPHRLASHLLTPLAGPDAELLIEGKKARAYKPGSKSNADRSSVRLRLQPQSCLWPLWDASFCRTADRRATSPPRRSPDRQSHFRSRLDQIAALM
jgi:hypothetical protein